jgi:tetratricopeptide (TPR) repeat protein
MSELLPRKIKIEDNTFLENLEFTSKWAEVASKYIIGNVKLLSGYIEPAFDLYNEVLSISNNYKGHVIESINVKSKNNIVLIFDIKITSLYEKWVETHDFSLFENIQLLLEEYKKFGIQNHQIETIEAIVLVLLFQDIENSLIILSKFPNQNRNATWLLNKAFLLASKGDLTAAYKEYKRALSRPEAEFYDGLINKAEDFIQIIIDQNKDIPQLHYCLGIINKEFKGDTILAKQDFENFISLTPIADYKNEKEIAKKWIEDIKKAA